MTIGIAAFGPNAGRAILLGLRAAERVGTGAIGGFVAFAGVTRERVLRAETQRGGTRGLFGGAGLAALSAELAGAPCAGLISSGPDRPEPLAQFVAARAGVGIVTGHRLPNAPGARRAGAERAVARRDGGGRRSGGRAAASARTGAGARCGAGGALDRRAVRAREHGPGRGSRRRGTRRGDDGIRAWCCCCTTPSSLETVWPRSWPKIASSAMAESIDDVSVRLDAGTRLRQADDAALWVDASGRVVRVDVTDGRLLSGERHLGLGYRIPVRAADGVLLGHVVREPLLVCRSGRVESVDGRTTGDVRVAAV